MSTRVDLAAALTATGLVTVTAKYRSNIKPLEGFIRWAGRIPDDSRLGFMDTWQAWIALSKDVPNAEEWLAANLHTLIAAVADVAVVTSADPAELGLGSNVINGLIIESVAVADPPA